MKGMHNLSNWRRPMLRVLGLDQISKWNEVDWLGGCRDIDYS
jgi:hypothetical protein